ncbi:hypothetical protein GK091_25120 [Spirosoma agri]|uniref:Uncharacterized protein n=1 Tax=Spirosoma agri TaxID=1987381 RepID=A0A6M0ISU6_9BACT|nr:hypothetical protein [Spirosoma agri]NEU70183.1 hypothetical protein [Spirosoma agri]
MAVLEVDPGETGDSFGDTFDTYLHSQPLHGPSAHAPCLLANTDLLVEPYSFLPLTTGYVYAPKLANTTPAPSPFTGRQRRHLLLAVWQI